MYSHEELISAVSAAGRDGKTFTVKDVRVQLGFDSRDKKELSRFRRRMRAFEKAAADQLEKLGNNSYRLRAGAFEQAPRPAAANAASATAPVAAEVQLEPASGVLQSARPANEPEDHVEPTLHAFESSAADTAPRSQAEQRVSRTQRVLSVASALVSNALAAPAAVSGRVRERGRNLREQLWSCLCARADRNHTLARVRGWAENVRPLSTEVREHLSALRQRVLAGRRRAA